MVFPGLSSRSVQFGTAHGEQLRVDFAAFPDLGIWTKPGAGYLCIEPWSGHADPAGFAGDITAKPGIRILQPGEHWGAAMTISLHPAATATGSG